MNPAQNKRSHKGSTKKGKKGNVLDWQVNKIKPRNLNTEQPSKRHSVGTPWNPVGNSMGVGSHTNCSSAQSKKTG